MALSLPGIAEAHVDTYPVEDHIADKVWATMTLYGGRPSSRPRDLYDLCAFAIRSEPEALSLGAALEEERMRRGLAETVRFQAPVEWSVRWKSLLETYPDSALPADFDDALALVRLLVDPVLAGDITVGRWDPADLRWVPSSTAGG